MPPMTIEIIQTITAVPRTLVTIETLSPFHAVPPRTDIEMGLPGEATVKTIGALVAETRTLDADEIVAEIGPVKAGEQTSIEGGGHPPPLGDHALSAMARITRLVSALKRLVLTASK